MVTLNLILSIIASIVKMAEHAAEKMTPEQFQAMWERHEARMAFWERLAAQFTTGHEP